MPSGNKSHFELLKQKIVATMQQSYPGINPSIVDWKGQEITDFQEDLLIKVNAHISEKWFYNHIKSKNKSLPRIDILNLLCKYVGYSNWDDFVYKNSQPTIHSNALSKANQYFIILPILVVVIVTILFLLFKLISNREYSFRFYDSHTKEEIRGNRIEIKLLSDNESAVNYVSDTSGTIIIKTDESVVKMLVSAPYYKPDTIIRILKTFEREQKISLHPNDYALIIHYFSQMKVDDWQKRRAYLSGIFDESAMIYQVLHDQNGPGMELYNKEEFINKLTLPTSTLKNIEILDTKFNNEKIMVLRFRVNDKK